MKKQFLLLFLLSALVPLSNFAQAPQMFKYQAIIREASGALIPNRSVSLRISILKTDIEGPLVYSESHKTTTTETGAINLEIGNGTILFGDFSEIDWSSDNHFVKIEVDKTGGSAYEQVGITQLLSVPYALYSEKSGDNDWENVANGISYSEGHVGIGTANPVHNLDIQSLNQTLGIYKSHFKGTESDGKGRLEIKSDPNDQGFQFLTSLNRIGDPSEDLILGLQHPIGNTTSWGILESWRGAGLMVSSSGPDLNPLTFGIDRVEKMRLTNEGFLGIGKTMPAFALDVNGTINSNQYLLNGTPLSNGQWNATGGGIFYNAGKVGIGTANPVHNLDIQSLNQTLGIYKSHFKGTESDGKGRLEIKSDPNDQGFQFLTSLNRIGDPSEELILGLQHPIGNTTSWGIFESWRGAGLMVSSSGPDLNPLTFGIDRVEKMRLTNDGYLGIGTTNPQSRLQVDAGDIYINDISSGIIMKSPNGQCWRMTVDNSGNPIFASISCP